MGRGASQTRPAAMEGPANPPDLSPFGSRRAGRRLGPRCSVQRVRQPSPRALGPGPRAGISRGGVPLGPGAEAVGLSAGTSLGHRRLSG